MVLQNMYRYLLRHNRNGHVGLAVNVFNRCIFTLALAILVILWTSCETPQMPRGIHETNQNSTQVPLGCTDILAVVNVFYEANDTAQYKVSLNLLSNSVTFDSWAQGAGGIKWPRSTCMVKPKSVRY